MKQKELVNNRAVNFENEVIHIQRKTASSDKDSIHSFHYHNSYQIIIVEKGSINMNIDYMPTDIESNSILILGKNLPHSIKSFSDDACVTLLHIAVNSPLLNSAFISDSIHDIELINDSKYGLIFKSKELVTKLLSLCRKIQKSIGFKQMSYIFLMLDLLSKYSEREKLVANLRDIPSTKKGVYNTPIERTFSYLYAHFQEEMTLTQIALYANQNATSLCRSFKKACGYTISQFVNRLRIERACYLLKNSDMTIEQIAYQVGFNNISHFNNQFKVYVNKLPSIYREE